MSSKNKPLQIPFGEWRPDVAHVNTPFLLTALGVYPTGTGYAPQKKLTAIGGGGSITGTALDAYAMPFSAATNFEVIAGTSTALFAKRPADSSWTDVTRSAGAYTSATYWSFAPFGGFLLAANGVDAPQVYTAGSLNDFAALGGSPPTFNFISSAGDFVWGCGTSAAPNLLHWSGINDQTSWTVGTDLSDQQIFVDGGPVFGVVGDKEGYVIQRGAIRRYRFLPGDTTTIFEFERLPGIMGPVNQKAYTVFANTLFYRSVNGIVALNQNGIRLIGVDKVDNYAATAQVPTQRVFADMHSGRIFFPYGTNNDSAIVYDTKHDRWTIWNNIDTADNIHSWVVAEEPTGSTHVYPLAIKSDGALYGLNGDKHEVFLQTAELELAPARRVTINGARLDSDVDLTEVTLTHRKKESLAGSPTSTNATANTTTGELQLLDSGRYFSFITAINETDDDWTYLNGITLWPQPDGEA